MSNSQYICRLLVVVCVQTRANRWAAWIKISRTPICDSGVWKAGSWHFAFCERMCSKQKSVQWTSKHQNLLIDGRSLRLLMEISLNLPISPILHVGQFWINNQMLCVTLAVGFQRTYNITEITFFSNFHRNRNLVSSRLTYEYFL